MSKDIDALIKIGLETNAGSVRQVIKRKDGTPLRAVCVYLEEEGLEAFLRDLDTLEEKHGLGV